MTNVISWSLVATVSNLENEQQKRDRYAHLHRGMRREVLQFTWVYYCKIDSTITRAQKSGGFFFRKLFLRPIWGDLGFCQSPVTSGGYWPGCQWTWGLTVNIMWQLISILVAASKQLEALDLLMQKTAVVGPSRQSWDASVWCERHGPRCHVMAVVTHEQGIADSLSLNKIAGES